MFDLELRDFIRYVESLEYVTEIEGGTRITTFTYGSGSGHAVCKTEIGSNIYIIEPQDDMIYKKLGNAVRVSIWLFASYNSFSKDSIDEE